MTTTMLWVGLIVAWMVVLVPMLAARHPRVNQVSDATLKTKLLHSGGSATRALRRRIRPVQPAAEAADRDQADEVETDEADADEADEVEADEVGADDALELAADDQALVEADLDEVPAPRVRAAAQADDEAHAFVDSDVAELRRSSPMDGDTVEITAVQRAEVEAPAPVPAVEIEAEVEAEPEVAPAEAEGTVDDADEAELDEQLTEEIEPARRPAAIAEPEEFEPPRRRRGGYDPENDARLTEARFRFRQRVTLVLGVLAVVLLGAGLVGLSPAWYGLGAVVAALVLYLAYLRRTVRIETEIRRRRMARLERARRERARESEILDGVPAHLRRGSCVVMEIDDEDPAFDHLPRYRAAEFDFLRNSSEQREPLERKVG